MVVPDVTLVVVPRERFQIARRSLESIYTTTSHPFSLIYVDGGSPRRTKTYLEAEARQRGFRLLRTERFLAPNEARNLGAAAVSTSYTVFVDNDVIVAPGWLEALVDCAERTGAAVVGPLYCHGELADETVHMTGGHAHIFDDHGVPRFHEDHRFFGRPLAAVRPVVGRELCEMVEFHCMLVRTEVLRRTGPLDEGLKSALENPDFCMSVRAIGGEIYFEPAAVITYIPPPPLAWADVPYFMRRWSDSWNRASLERFREKWNLRADDPQLVRQFKAWTRWRRQAFVPHDSLLARVLLSRAGPRLAHVLGRMEGRLNRGLISGRSHG